MADSEREDGTTRDDLVQRVALMEEMIAEGRQSTARFGWCFVLWGVITLIGIGCQYFQPNSYWDLPVVSAVGIVIQLIGIAIRRRSGHTSNKNMQSRAIAAVWGMTGLAMVVYLGPGIMMHDTGWFFYVPTIFMFLGLAHAISAIILRWWVQGVVAGLWWAGEIAVGFFAFDYMRKIFVAEMVVCMVLFGLYAMWLERQGAAAEGLHHA